MKNVLKYFLFTIWSEITSFGFPIRRHTLNIRYRHLYGPANASNRSLGVPALYEDTCLFRRFCQLVLEVCMRPETFLQVFFFTQKTALITNRGYLSVVCIYYFSATIKRLFGPKSNCPNNDPTRNSLSGI